LIINPYWTSSFNKIILDKIKNKKLDINIKIM